MQEKDDIQLSCDIGTISAGCGLMQEKDDIQQEAELPVVIKSCGLMQEKDDIQRHEVGNVRVEVVV